MLTLRATSVTDERSISTTVFTLVIVSPGRQRILFIPGPLGRNCSFADCHVTTLESGLLEIQILYYFICDKRRKTKQFTLIKGLKK